MSLNDTQDLFFLILAISVAVLTFFTAWLLYYIVSMLRTANRVIQSVDEKLQLIEGILHSLKENVSNSSAALVLLTKAIARLVKFGIEKKNARDMKKGKKGASANSGKQSAADTVADFFDDSEQ